MGAVVVDGEGDIIGEGFNAPVGSHDPSAHAEAQAIRAAGKQVDNYRLVDSTLYVTLEPCAMCAGALVLARIERLVFGAMDPRTGMVGSLENLVSDVRLNHRMTVSSGVLAEESGTLLRDYFKVRRS